MNINKLYNCLPETDDFLEIQLEYQQLSQILPEYNDCKESCICIYGVLEEELNQLLGEVNHKADEYVQLIRNCMDVELWDLLIKPILLFEDKEYALSFIDYSNQLDEENYLDFICKLQCDYNEPWGKVKMIKKDELKDILYNYEKRFE